MNDSAIWLIELTRATVALSLSMLVVAALTRLLKIRSATVHRWACFLVLLQGWLVLRPTVELPWGEPQPTVAVVSARTGGLAANPSGAMTRAAPIAEMVDRSGGGMQHQTSE